MSDIWNKIENISVTQTVIKLLREEEASDDSRLGKFKTRVMGLIATPFTLIIDTIMHSVLCAGETVTGIIATPYNSIARAIDPKFRFLAPKELELISAHKHLTKAIKNLFNIIVLPIDSVKGPGAALANYQSQSSLIHATDFNVSEKQNLIQPIETDLEIKNTIAAIETDVFTLKERYKSRGIVVLEIYVDKHKIALEFCVDSENGKKLHPYDVCKAIKHKLKALSSLLPEKLENRFVVSWSIILERRDDCKAKKPGDYTVVSGWKSALRDSDDGSRRSSKKRYLFPVINAGKSIQEVTELALEKSGLNQSFNVDAASSRFEKLFNHPDRNRHHYIVRTDAPASKLKAIEKLSLTQSFLELIKNQENKLSDEDSIFFRLGLRSIALMTTPLTSLIDVVAHAVFFVGKAATGSAVTPYNRIIQLIDPKKAAPKELEWGSSLQHLARSIQSIFNVVMLPLFVLLDFDYAYAHAQVAPKSFDVLTPHEKKNDHSPEGVFKELLSRS